MLRGIARDTYGTHLSSTGIHSELSIKAPSLPLLRELCRPGQLAMMTPWLPVTECRGKKSAQHEDICDKNCIYILRGASVQRCNRGRCRDVQDATGILRQAQRDAARQPPRPPRTRNQSTSQVPGKSRKASTSKGPSAESLFMDNWVNSGGRNADNMATSTGASAARHSIAGINGQSGISPNEHTLFDDLQPGPQVVKTSRDPRLHGAAVSVRRSGPAREHKHGVGRPPVDT